MKLLLTDVNTLINSCLFNFSTLIVVVNLPMNSGIIPYLTRSSGLTSLKCPSDLSLSSDPNPKEEPVVLLLITSSNPPNAPPAIKSIFFVSISTIGSLGCLRLPLGATRTVVPSTIFKSACWTPSPLTSRVIETFSLLRATLSISSIKMMTRSAFATSPSALAAALPPKPKSSAAS